jgi:dihydroorotate dehydrogenase (NAD+) catalytic subunit
LLNSIGIPSKGLPYFLKNILPEFEQYATPLIVSISAPTAESFAVLAEQLDLPGIAAIEANISCPNIEEDGKAFAMRAKSTSAVVERLRKATSLPLWVKLTPNTGDVANVARAAEASGADALVVANTILAMSINIDTFKPTLGNIMGGYSGPAIKPIVVRMVYQCAKAVRIPVIGCGGISTAADAIEYILAGASAVQVGTATFVNPSAMLRVIDGLQDFCDRKGIARISALTGAIRDRDMQVGELEAIP